MKAPETTLIVVGLGLAALALLYFKSQAAPSVSSNAPSSAGVPTSQASQAISNLQNYVNGDMAVVAAAGNGLSGLLTASNNLVIGVQDASDGS